MSLGIPTLIAMRALGMNAELVPDIGPEGVCSIQRIPETNQSNPPATQSVNNGTGSRIVLGNDRPHVLSASTLTPECNGYNGITRVPIYGSIARNLKEAHEREGEGEVPSDTSNEQL